MGRVAGGSGGSEATTELTPTWQFAIFPAEPVYAASRQQNAFPGSRKPVSSTIQVGFDRVPGSAQPNLPIDPMRSDQENSRACRARCWSGQDRHEPGPRSAPRSLPSPSPKMPNAYITNDSRKLD